MRRYVLLSMVQLALWSTACAKGNAHTDTPQTIEATSGQAPSDRLVGSWLLRTDPPLDQPGIRITVTIDSVTGTQFWGRLTHFFSGNVGTDPGLYEPFVGSVEASGDLRLAIEAAGQAAPQIAIAGRLTTDTVVCTDMQLGPDTMTGGGRAWFLVRESR